MVRFPIDLDLVGLLPDDLSPVTSTTAEGPLTPRPRIWLPKCSTRSSDGALFNGTGVPRSLSLVSPTLGQDRPTTLHHVDDGRACRRSPSQPDSCQERLGIRDGERGRTLVSGGCAAASDDGALIGTEVARDDLGVVADFPGMPLGDHVPGFEAVDPSEMPMIRFMSCSISNTEADSSFLMEVMSGPKASVSRCASPPVGSSRQSTLAFRAKSPASSTTRRVPVERSDT